VGSRTVTVVVISIVEVDVTVCVIVVPFSVFVEADDGKSSGGPITQLVSMVVTIAIDVDVAFACEEVSGCV
jgi:hypothetical protein